jgi:hypothetical protein
MLRERHTEETIIDKTYRRLAIEISFLIRFDHHCRVAASKFPETFPGFSRLNWHFPMPQTSCFYSNDITFPFPYNQFPATPIHDDIQKLSRR